MKTRYITEKDFVPSRISQFEKHNETENGLFQIVYGVMQHRMSYDDIYDLIVRLSKEQKSEVVKRFKLLAWKVEVETLLKKLRKFDVEDYRVVVVVPFTEYVEEVSYTINQFQLVLYTINEILDKGDAQMTIIDDPWYNIPPKSIPMLLEDSYLKFIKDLPEEMSPDKPYYRSLFFDEMLRRGMTNFKSDELIVDPNAQKIINSQELFKLTPSEYYNQPEKFFDILDLASGEEWKKLRTKYESEESGNSNDTDTSNDKPNKKDYQLGAVGTIFFMLKDLSQEAVDKKNKKKIAAMINYILDLEPGCDTTRSYVDKILGITAKSHTFKFYNKVKANLTKYGFGVPKVISEGYENTEQ